MKTSKLTFAARCVLVMVLGWSGWSTNGLGAAPVFRAGYDLPNSGGPGQLAGDLVWTPQGGAAVYAQTADGETRLAFHRLGPDAKPYLERVHSLAPWPCYEPALAYDGEDFGVALSGLTQAFFLRLSPTGEILTGPVQLPGLPSGTEAGRTAGFKVIWTGQSFAVFGLWLERVYAGQDLTQGPFYTHLRYWLLDRQGQTLAARDLRVIAPISYPASEGGERNHYDAVWTGDRFFVAYSGESELGPPVSVYYRTQDASGTWLTSEQRLLAGEVAQGPKLAWSGNSVAATALKVIPLPASNAGNYMFFRCFRGDGTPLGPEIPYGQKLGYGPTVTWIGDRFLTTYCVIHNLATLGYALMFNAFDEAGRPVGTEQPMRDTQGTAVTGRMAFGVDLQIVGHGNLLYGKAQDSDAFALRTHPVWFTLNNDWLTPPRLSWGWRGAHLMLRWPADAAPFVLEQTMDPGRGSWEDAADAPDFEAGDFWWRPPQDGRGFFRLRN